MERRKLETEILDKITTLAKVREKRNKAEAIWKEVVQNGRELREKELLDIYNQIIEGDDEKEKKLGRNRWQS